MNTTTLHYYRKARAHQNTDWANGGGCLTVYRDGRTEMSYGSAPYGEHALSAFISAKRHVHFMRDLRATVKGR